MEGLCEHASPKIIFASNKGEFERLEEIGGKDLVAGGGGRLGGCAGSCRLVDDVDQRRSNNFTSAVTRLGISESVDGSIGGEIVKEISYGVDGDRVVKRNAPFLRILDHGMPGSRPSDKGRRREGWDRARGGGEGQRGEGAQKEDRARGQEMHVAGETRKQFPKWPERMTSEVVISRWFVDRVGLNSAGSDVNQQPENTPGDR